MLKILLLILAVFVGGVYLVKNMGQQPPLRGLVRVSGTPEAVLLSRARPAVSFVPAGDMRFHVAGWRTLNPGTRLSHPGDARIWFAAYRNAAGLLVTALAEAEGDWEWEAPHHTPFPPLQEEHYPYKGGTLYESIAIIAAEDDPFVSAYAGKPAYSLVFRGKMLLHFRKMQVIMEYREALADHLPGQVPDGELLKSFRRRAVNACEIVFPDQEKLKRLSGEIERMEAADPVFGRAGLSRWVGEIRRPGDL